LIVLAITVVKSQSKDSYFNFVLMGQIWIRKKYKSHLYWDAYVNRREY